MTENEFQNEEFQFLEQLKSSSLYQRMLQLSKQMDEDETLLALAKERDHFLSLADQEKAEGRKRELLLSFHQKDEEIRAHPLMQEYLSIYQTLRTLLTHLADALTKEIKIL